MSKAAKLALEIANDLFTDGSGRKGDHLQITNGVPPNDVYLAGWSESAVAGRVARILEPHLVGEWLPIESAPKNGKIILGFCDARICTQGLVKAIWSARKGFWVSLDGAEGYDLTHWQPLPPPPKGEQSHE